MKLIYIKLSEFQKNKLRRAFQKRENISLKVALANEKTGDRIYVNDRQYNKIMKGKPVIINFNDTHYRAKKQDGGSLLSSLIGPLTTVVSKAAPVLTKTVLLGLATGVATALGSLGIDSIFSGKGIDGKTGDIIKALAVIENELRKMPKSQKSKFDEVMVTGNGQTGGFLSTLLATLGIPLILKAISGSGLHNRPWTDTTSYKTHRKKIPIIPQNQPVVKQPEGTALNEWEIYNPPPFNDNHEIIESKGRGLKTKRSKNTWQRHSFRRQQNQSLQERGVTEYPVLKFKNTSTTNIYLKTWIDHMGVNNHFGGIYAKDQLTTDMIKQNHFYIINLDDSIGPGTHWTCFYYKNRKIEYFDSYGLKPPKIISSYKYIYNSSQLQSYDTTSCGFYCLYYIYHRNIGLTFYDIIKRFNLVDLEYNQNLIKEFFNNYN